MSGLSGGLTANSGEMLQLVLFVTPWEVFFTGLLQRTVNNWDLSKTLPLCAAQKKFSAAGEGRRCSWEGFTTEPQRLLAFRLSALCHGGPTTRDHSRMNVNRV